MDLSQFLPSLGHPLFGPILAELVRADLEFGWQQGRPKSLEHYQRQFPDLAEYADLWPQIAFEEYRLRRQAGENASPEDYRARLGSAVDDWPILEKNGRLKTTNCDSKDIDGSSEGSHLVATRVLSIPPLLNPDFIRAAPTNSQKDDGISAWPTMGSQEHAEQLCELHKSEPAVAQRLAKALQEMPEAGSDFEGFRLVAELGRGAFGRVFLAQQKELAGRLVALKISTDLFHESQTLAQLQHTHIVPIYSYHHGQPYQAVCMPYLGSTTLAHVLADAGIGEDDSVAIMCRNHRGFVEADAEARSKALRPVEAERLPHRHAEQPGPQIVHGRIDSGQRERGAGQFGGEHPPHGERVVRTQFGKQGRNPSKVVVQLVQAGVVVIGHECRGLAEPGHAVLVHLDDHRVLNRDRLPR